MNRFEEALISTERSPLIPADADYFGPLIGVWDFVWKDDCGPGGTHREVAGEWLFARTLDGTAVQDLFICPSRATRASNPQPDGEYGTTLWTYNPRTCAWDICYGCAGVMNRLEARREGDEIVLTEVTHGRIKYIFSRITDRSFHWRRIESGDGETWYLVAEVHATRSEER